MFRPVAVVCLVVAGWFVGPSLISSTGSGVVEPFRLSTYPRSPTEAVCGHPRNPRLCDPDGVLKESTLFPLADDVTHRNVTVSGRKNGGVFPVQYGVAVMRKMDLTTTGKSDSMNTLYDEPLTAAEIFARSIHDTWGVGTPSGGGTGVVIFLSVDDRTVYFSRGKALERVLRDRRMDAIIETMKPLLRKQQYDQAMLLAIKELDQYLVAGSGGQFSEWFSTWYNDWSDTILVSTVGFLIFAYFVRKDLADRRQYARVSTHLSEIDRTRAEALQGMFRATSCPICLENFKKKRDVCTVIPPNEGEGEAARSTTTAAAEATSQTEPLVGSSDAPIAPDGEESSGEDELVGSDGLSLRLLRCGHTFDETCWQEWINNGSALSIHRCPICQQDVGQEPEASWAGDPLSIPRGGQNDMAPRTNNNDETEVEMAARLALRQFIQDRNFRLTRLAERYPQYIQRDELQRWTQVSYDGSLVRDSQLARAAAVEASEKNSWFGRDSTSGFSGGFSGGCSSGGRGGTW